MKRRLATLWLGGMAIASFIMGTYGIYKATGMVGVAILAVVATTFTAVMVLCEGEY